MLGFLTGWRTLIFNSVVTVLAGLQATDIATIVPDKYAPVAITGIGLINLVLRSLTKTPVGAPEKTMEITTGTIK